MTRAQEKLRAIMITVVITVVVWKLESTLAGHGGHLGHITDLGHVVVCHASLAQGQVMLTAKPRPRPRGEWRLLVGESQENY